MRSLRLQQQVLVRRWWRDVLRNLHAISWGFMLFLGVPGAPAQAADINPVRFVTPNGITVLFLEQHYLPTVEIHALIKVGSAQDPPEKAGLANLVASLLDEGTQTRSSKQIAEQIDFVGGSLGAKASEDFTTASARAA